MRVDVARQLGRLDGARHRHERGFVEDAADLAHRMAHRASVADVALDDLEPIVGVCEREVFPSPAAEVVEDAHGVTLAEQALREVRSDEAGAPRHEEHPTIFTWERRPCRGHARWKGTRSRG